MAMGEVTTFHWADYLVFGVILLLSALVGVYYRFSGQRQSSTSEFLMGGRKMNLFPVAFSLQASFLSAIFIMGTPAEIYFNGALMCWLLVSYFIALPLAAHFYLPVFHKLQLTSAYEYLEQRFHWTVKLAGSAAFMLQTVLYIGVVLYTPALAINQVTGLSIYISIIVIGFVCTFYTALGGLKAVVWTDALQMVIIYAGFLALIVCGLREVNVQAATGAEVYNTTIFREAVH